MFAECKADKQSDTLNKAEFLTIWSDNKEAGNIEAFDKAERSGDAYVGIKDAVVVSI